MPASTRPAAIFDLDGTLVDSLPEIAAAVNAMLARFDAPALDALRVRTFIGDGAAMLAQRALAARNLSETVAPDRALAEFRAAYDAHGHADVHIYDGALAVLDALRDDGVAIGICTNKDGAAARDLLAATPLGARVDAVIGGGDLPERKPDPAPLLRCADLLSAERCVYIGDSEVDAETSDAAGIPFLFHDQGYWRDPARPPNAPRFSRYADAAALIRNALGI